MVQNAAARFLTGVRKHQHITRILKALNWLPVRHRVDLKILMFVFKSLNGLAPSYLSELLNLNTSGRCLRSTKSYSLAQPRTWLKLRGDCAFAVVGPRLWNSLPFYLRSLSSVQEFKSKLKSYLLAKAFSNYELCFMFMLYCFLSFLSCILVLYSVKHSGRLLLCSFVLFK